MLTQASRTSPRRYRAQTNILFQGEIPAMALFIVSGFVAAYTIKDSGDEQIVGLFSKGDIIPAEWLFGKSPVALYYYKAFTDCELMAVGRAELMESVAKDQAFTTELLERYVSSFISATVHIHALEHSNSREKLIKIFHYLVLRFGVPKPTQKDLYSIPVPLTHTHIAGMIGLARETVTHGVIELRRKGNLEYKGGFYTINLPKLLKSMGSEEFDTLEL